jgi:predicted TIM-barrel enzyme
LAYPPTHRLNVVHKSSYSSSIGASPVAAYIRVPFRSQVTLVDAVTHGTITTADCSVAVALNGTAISGSPFVIPVSGAAAGQVASMTPTSPIYANVDDVLSFTPSGASGSNIAATFSAALKAN